MHKQQKEHNMKWTKEILSDIVKHSLTKTEVLRKMNLGIFAGNYKTLNKYLT